MRGESALRHLLQPIQHILDDPATTEVVINEPGVVGWEADNRWSWVTCESFTYRRVDAIAILAGGLLSKRFDGANPIVETTLPARHRFTAIRPPATLPGHISLTIRKPSTQNVGDIEEPDFAQLVEEATHHANQSHPADEELVALYTARDWSRFAGLAVESGKSIAAVGPQKSGKTTLLRRLMKKIPPRQRLVTVEDTEEFGDLPLRNRVSLIYGSAGVTAEKLIMTSLRMAADRVAMQELRGPEAFSYFKIHLAGTEGGFTSWHAENGDAFQALALMIRGSEAGRHYTGEELMALLRGMIDVIFYCHKDSATGAHSVPSIYFRLANAHRAH